MGMFDSFYDAQDNDWQTKAFGRSLAQWSIGDAIPGAHPLPFQDKYNVGAKSPEARGLRGHDEHPHSSEALGQWTE
jgi:hypothetical protein